MKRSEVQKVTFHLQNKVLAHVKKFLEPHTDCSGSLTEMCPEKKNEKTQKQKVFPTKSKSLEKKIKI